MDADESRRCPVCDAQILGVGTFCGDCAGDLKVAASIQSQVEALNAERALLEHGIPCLVCSLENAYLDGILLVGAGHWGTILVPERELERARDVIEKELDLSEDSLD